MKQDEFLSKYNISKEEFKKSKVEWDKLIDIFDHFEKHRDDYIPVAEEIAKRLMKVKKVHSVRYRVKDSEHLIEKIVRKKIDNPDLDFNIENYADKLNDIIGVRAMHLYKSNWETIGRFILDTWQQKETPKAYVRLGDDEELTKKYKDAGYEVNNHKYGYRSLHYIISSKPTIKEYKCELQVRTVFEEGWSEIDHDVRYPYDIDNPIFKGYLVMFNRLAGNADDMGTYIKFLQKEIGCMQEKHNNEIGEMKTIIKDLKNQINNLKVNDSFKVSLNKGIDQLVLSSSTLSVFPTVDVGNLVGSNTYFTIGSKCSTCGKTYTPNVFGASTQHCSDCSGKVFFVNPK